MAIVALLLVFVFGSCLAQNSGYFQVVNTQLNDPNGKPFLIRGISNMHVPYDGFGQNKAIAAVPYIAQTNANTLRVFWSNRLDVFQLSIDHLEDILETAVNNSLVVVLTLFDLTCQSNSTQLLQLAQWYVDNSALLIKYQKYLLLNIANEWSPYNTTVWRDTYISAISLIRSSGFNGTLVIDTDGCGQDPTAIIQYGQAVLQSDPQQNIVFSIHMYSQWSIDQGIFNIGDNLAQIQSLNLAVIVGEFAANFQLGWNCQILNINATEIISQASAKNIGYIGWSWQGNADDCTGGNSPLNILSDMAGDISTWAEFGPFTDWGNTLIYSSGIGLNDSGKKATVF